MIITDKLGRKLSLTTRRLTQLGNRGWLCCTLELKNLPLERSLMTVDFVRMSGQTTIGVDPATRKIGCCYFTTRIFRAIMRRARAAKKAEASRDR